MTPTMTEVMIVVGVVALALYGLLVWGSWRYPYEPPEDEE